MAELLHNCYSIITERAIPMIIKPSTTLRHDYRKISAMAHETGEPIYITKNGEGDIVIMSFEAFEKLKQKMLHEARLELAEKSQAAEPVVSLAAIRAQQEAKYLETVFSD